MLALHFTRSHYYYARVRRKCLEALSLIPHAISSNNHNIAPASAKAGSFIFQMILINSAYASCSRVCRVHVFVRARTNQFRALFCHSLACASKACRMRRIVYDTKRDGARFSRECSGCSLSLSSLLARRAARLNKTINPTNLPPRRRRPKTTQCPKTSSN